MCMALSKVAASAANRLFENRCHHGFLRSKPGLKHKECTIRLACCPSDSEPSSRGAAKQYLAICYGHLEEDALKIETPIAEYRVSKGEARIHPTGAVSFHAVLHHFLTVPAPTAVRRRGPCLGRVS